MGLAICFFCVLCFCGFLEVFFWFLTKSIKNLEKTKKNADPNSPACAYMGLAILFFLCSLFLWFSRVFFLVFDQKYQKSEKTKKIKKNKMQTLTHQLVRTWVLHFFLIVFLFSRGFYQSIKTSRKR